MMDLVFYSRRRVTIRAYLLIINVNTRFLAVSLIQDRSTNEIFKVLDTFINEYSHSKPICFKGDGEKGFAAVEKMMKILKYTNVNFYLDIAIF
jgi:hypothetical protein